MSNEQKIGFCKYCGVSVMVPEDAGKCQDEWNEAATQKCNCKAAQDARWKEAVLEDFAENMKRLSVGEKERRFLESGAELIADGVLGYVQIKTETDDTIKIAKKSGGIFLRKTKRSTEELLSDGVYK